MKSPREQSAENVGFTPRGELRLATTPPLTGGSGYTRPDLDLFQKRPLPEIEVTEVRPGYACLLAQGFDSFQEAINLKCPPALVELLEAKQNEAKALDTRKGQAVTITLGDEVLQVWPCGSKGGVRYVLECDDFLLMFRNPQHEWCLSVRYLSAGIWENGMRCLRERVYALLEIVKCVVCSTSPARVSRADWAFDIYSKKFRDEMRPALMEQIVCHSSVKVNMWGNASGLETLTIGKSPSTLQIQVYDKTKEITEASGKGWMVDLWLGAGWEPMDGEITDVWRVEVRMGGDWLKSRQANTPDALSKSLPELVTEALFTHRLTEVSETDCNRARWPLHKMFSLCVKSLDAREMMPIGRKVQGTRDVIMDRLTRQLAGTLRSASVLRTGDWTEEEAQKLANESVRVMLKDPHGARKAEAARERYRFIEEAR